MLRELFVLHIHFKLNAKRIQFGVREKLFAQEAFSAIEMIELP
ncbi:MAG: hypothetical protein AB8B95_08320 [Pseudohongiellaceae bacterium]